jgi:hypothetical protein
MCSDIPGGATKARLANLSVHGLSLILDKKLHVGSLVKVEWGSDAFVGEVVYCQAQGQETLVGLKVENPVYETVKKYASQ